MQNNISVSAPGKLILFGEHAVVYHRPCIVTSVDQRLNAKLEVLPEEIFQLDAGDVGIKDYRKPLRNIGKGDIPKGAVFVESAVKNYMKKFQLKQGIKVTTASGFSGKYGFGSSSAAAVCTIKGLSGLFGEKLSDNELFNLSYQAVLDVQGCGSGFDVASAIFGGTLYFITGGEKIEPVKNNMPHLVIGFSGIKADTAALVKEVKVKYDNENVKVNRIFDAIAGIVSEARSRLIEGDWERVGKLMDFNQEYLRNLGVSTHKLEDLISAAKKSGAYGAKLSGAGGGDSMIALTDTKHETAVESAVRDAGGEVINVPINAPGIKIETKDDQDELFIVVDKEDNILAYKSRSECHRDKSLIHRTVGILIYNQKGELLLQKRSITKDTDAGKWAISSGGHVSKGQSYEEAMQRELMEELGVKIPFRKVKKFIADKENETEMAVLYEGICDKPFKINPDEIEKVEFYSLRKLKFLADSNILDISPGSMITFKEAGIL